MRQKKEEALQLQVSRYLSLQYPDVIFTSDASGLKLPMGLAAKWAKMRCARYKLPDMIILQPNATYAGLVLELKKDINEVFTKAGEMRKDQHILAQAATLKKLEVVGYAAHFACGFDHARQIIDRYMKIVLLLLLPFLSFSQKQKGYWQKQSAIITMGLIAGFADGQREVIQHNPYSYAARHPQANPMWWNPKYSWRNKYNGGNQNAGEKYPLSTSVLAFTTDKYHMNQFIRNAMFAGQTGVSLTLREKWKLKQIALQLAINWGSYAMGKGVAHWYYRQ